MQLKLYQDKYHDAKKGLDVFAIQALIYGITQEEYRQIVIKKGDYLIQKEKETNDLIESVRQALEAFVDSVNTDEDITKFKEKLQIVDEFRLGDDVSEFVKKLKE